VSNQGSKMMTIHTSGKMEWEKETKVVQWHFTRPKKHEIVQKTPQQNFEGNQEFCQFHQNQTDMIRMSVVITLWVSLAKYQTITFIVNSSDELPWLPIDFISTQQWAPKVTQDIRNKTTHQPWYRWYTCEFFRKARE
jgi:hypothetical protein